MATPRHDTDPVNATDYLIVENARKGIDPRSQIGFTSRGTLTNGLNSIINQMQNAPQYEIDDAVTDRIAKYYGSAAALHDSGVQTYRRARDAEQGSFDDRFPGETPGDMSVVERLVYDGEYGGAARFKSLSNNIAYSNDEIATLDTNLADTSREVIDVLRETTDPLSPNAAITIDTGRLRGALIDEYKKYADSEQVDQVAHFSNIPLSDMLTVGDVSRDYAQQTERILHVKLGDGPVSMANQALVMSRENLPFIERVNTLQDYESLSSIIGHHIDDQVTLNEHTPGADPNTLTNLHNEISQVFQAVQDPQSPLFDHEINMATVTRLANAGQPTDDTPVADLISETNEQKRRMQHIFDNHERSVEPARAQRASMLNELPYALSNSKLITAAKSGIDERINVRFEVDATDTTPSVGFMNQVNSPLLGAARSPHATSHRASVSLGKQLAWSVLDGRTSTETARQGTIHLLEQSLDPKSKTLAIDIDTQLVDDHMNSIITSMRGPSEQKTSVRDILMSTPNLRSRAYAQSLLDRNDAKIGYNVNETIDRQIEQSQERDLNRDNDHGYDY